MTVAFDTIGPAGARGLTTDEVAERIRDGKRNNQPHRTSRTYRSILAGNILTRFNLIISALAVVVFAVGSPGDALFAGVMVANAVIGIVQEIRAKRTLDRLRILVTPAITVHRDGCEIRLAPDDLVLDDVLILTSGDQVPVDGVVLAGDTLEVDESALTGESDAVHKVVGDEVKSGSAVVSGSATIIATRVGEDAWIHKLVVEAKEFVLATSELRSGVDQILRIVGFGLVPLGALLVWSQLRVNEETDDGLIAAVAGMVGLVPQGLVLMVSMALAVAVIRLAREHVVIQELHAVEGLARVDVFCVDKTGTLTTGSMQVEVFQPLDVESDVVAQALCSLATVDASPTTTLQTIVDHLGERAPWAVAHHVPFSSARKWSGAVFDSASVAVADTDRTWILGAPEILLEHVAPEGREAVAVLIAESVARARRVVLVASTDEELGDTLSSDLTPRAVVALSEQVRPDAHETMDYFQRQDVTVKVISGDNPETVSAVAASIGITGAENHVDMRTVPPDDDDALARVIEANTVFGRVQPDQKRDIVSALQRAGHTVAMTGDGVNDIPALKRADIGVAIDTATSATKAVSQLILLDGRFDRMPHVVAEGRRVVANMERVSSLFVTKTVYSALFAIAIGLSGSVFPLLPRQMSLVSELTIGVPAFFLSFRAADAACRPGYLGRVLRFAVPAGTATALVTLAVYWIARSPLTEATLAEARTAATVALIVFAFGVLLVLVFPVDRFDAVLMSALILAFLVTLAIEPVRDFYRLVRPSNEVAVIGAAIVLAGAFLTLTAIRVSLRSGRST